MLLLSYAFRSHSWSASHHRLQSVGNNNNNFFWQRLAGEQHFVQPIRGKPRFVPADFCGNSAV